MRNPLVRPCRLLAAWIVICLPLGAGLLIEMGGEDGAKADLVRTGDFAGGEAPQGEPAPPVWPFDKVGGIDRETALLLHLDNPAALADAADPKRSIKATGVTATDGHFGGGLSFTGKAKVTIGGSPLGLSLQTPFRIETWVRPRRGGVALSLDRRFYVLVLRSKDGKWVAHLKHRKSDKGGDFGSVYSSPLPLADKAWHHLAIVYDGKGGVEFLCDGKPAGKSPMPHQTESTGFGDGCLGAHDGWLGWYDGDLDEVRVQVRRLPRGRARLQVRLQDEKGQPLPARCSLVGGDGKPIDPVGKGMSKRGEFSAEGLFSTAVPAGTCRLRAQRDWRWNVFAKPFAVASGGDYTLTVTLARWYDTQGWLGGNTHFHSYHGPKHRIKVATLDEKGQRDYEASGLMCRASGLDWALSNDPDQDLPRAVAASRPKFLMSLANERRCDYWCGHMNAPGTKGLRANNKTPFAALSVIAEGHAQGGALIYTHPMNLPRVHHMTSVAALSHASLSADLGADLFDIGCGNRDLAFAELLAFWGSGWRLGVASANDLGLEGGGDVGSTQTYVRPATFEWPAVQSELRSRRTIGVVGDAFAMIEIDGQGPGGKVAPGRHTVKVRAAARQGLKAARLLVNGVPQELPEAKGKREFEASQELELANGDWVTVEARGTGYAATALATPVWCGEPVRGDRHTAILVVSNFDRAGRQAKSFWAHLIATVNDSRQIAATTLLRDGKEMRTAKAKGGNRLPENGLLPLVGGAPKKDKSHQPSWVFWPSAAKAQHIRMSWPVPEPATYSFRVTLVDGTTFETGGVKLTDTETSYCHSTMQFRSPQSSLWTQSSAKGTLNTDYNHLYFTVDPYIDAVTTVNGHPRHYSRSPNPQHRAIFTPPAWVPPPTK